MADVTKRAPKQEPEPVCVNPYTEALKEDVCDDPACTYVQSAMMNEWCPHASDYRHCAVEGCHGAIYLGGAYCHCGECNACICYRHYYERSFRCTRCALREARRARKDAKRSL